MQTNTERERVNEREGACERAGDITRVDATWNAARRGTHTGDPHRGPTQRGPTQGTHTGDPHRGPTQGTHTGDPHRGEGPTEDPPPEGGPHRGPTQNTHRKIQHAHTQDAHTQQRGLGLGLTRVRDQTCRSLLSVCVLCVCVLCSSACAFGFVLG